MKIAVIGIVGVPASYGGFETLVENLIEDDMRSYTVYCSSSHYPEKIVSYKNARLIYLPFRANGLQSIVYDVFSIFHALWSGHRDFLILGTSGACVLPFVRLFFPNIKIVINIDGLEWQRQKWSSLTRRFLRLSERLAVRFSSIVVADNQAIARYVEVTYKRCCETIAYGGDHAVIDAMIVPDTGAVTDRDPYAFALCRIEPENNPHMILEAFATGKLNLIFVGNWQASDYGRDLLRRYSNVPGIEMIKPIYDLHALACYRRNCEIYVHGHSAGGTNPSLVEMMHFDKPIVAFDCVYNRVTLEGIGHYFSSVSTLSHIVEEGFFYNDGVKFGDIARRRYTWRIVRKQYRELFYSDEECTDI